MSVWYIFITVYHGVIILGYCNAFGAEFQKLREKEIFNVYK